MKTPAKLTLQDIAARAGVSRSLASLALRGERGVQADKRALVLKIAEELNYRPNPAARRLASRSTGMVGILVSDILNPFSASLAQSIDLAARAKGFEVLLSIQGGTDEAAESALDALLLQRVDGLILIGAPKSVPMIEGLGRRVPVVYVGRHLSTEIVDSVSNDDHLGATIMVRHLIDLGHRNIVHVDGGNSAGSQGRRDAYAAAMFMAGLTPQIFAGRHTLDGGVQATEEILSLTPCPTAIFASNDLQAIGILNRVLQAGLRVPQDMAIAGYDDIPISSSEALSLTTARQHVDRMALHAVDILAARIAKPANPSMHVLIAPTLMVRRTTTAKG